MHKTYISYIYKTVLFLFDKSINLRKTKTQNIHTYINTERECKMINTDGQREPKRYIHVI